MSTPVREIIELPRREELLVAREAITDMAVATGDPTLQPHLDAIAIQSEHMAVFREEEECSRRLNAHGHAREWARREIEAEQVLLWHLDLLDRRVFPESH